MTDIFIRRENFETETQRHTEIKQAGKERQAEIRVILSQLRKASDHQKLEKVKSGSSRVPSAAHSKASTTVRE